MDEMLAKIAEAHTKQMKEIAANATEHTQQAARDHSRYVEAPWLYGDELVTAYLESIKAKADRKTEGDTEDG